MFKAIFLVRVDVDYCLLNMLVCLLKYSILTYTASCYSGKSCMRSTVHVTMFKIAINTLSE
jgi:hypothetical protein